MEYKSIITAVHQKVDALKHKGQLATYIPELGKVNPEKFGAHISTLDHQMFGVGDYREKFSIQSIAKVFALSLAYKMLGEKMWSRLDVEPSGTTFNSLIQLELENGIPRNPFINAGALVICDLLISNLKQPRQHFLAFVRDICDNPELNYSQKIINSEKSVGYRNVALCNLIKSYGNIKNDPEEVLAFYFSLCSLEMDCQELSRSFLFLANGGCKLSDNTKILSKRKAKRINAIMLTCGFYDESGEFAFKVGLPGKSGVGGGIIALHPTQYTIAVWSPKLNNRGNSYKGMKFLEEFTSKTKSSIF